MDKETTITLPKLGESIVSATIVRWFKKEGDPILLDEALLEVSTDKVSSEIPSPVSGVLTKILALPDQEIDVGAPLAIIRTQAASTPAPQAPEKRTTTATSSDQSSVFSPALLHLAKEAGLSLQDLDSIPRTGEGGRLTKKDLENYLSQKKSPQDGKERIKMSPMRKAIADNMVRSFYTAPHATLITEIDVTTLIKSIDEHKEAFFAKHGAKLTITSVIAQSIALSLQSYPLLNASIDQDSFVLHRSVNLGIAVSIDQGVLVPVIKNCHLISLGDIANAIYSLSTKARAGALSPEEMGEGTITLTNFGMSGVKIGIPIIRYPEVAIVAIGATHKKVIPLENDTLAVHSFINVSLTFDHRVLDGMYGCAFLNHLQHQLEYPSIPLT